MSLGPLTLLLPYFTFPPGGRMKDVPEMGFYTSPRYGYIPVPVPLESDLTKSERTIVDELEDKAFGQIFGFDRSLVGNVVDGARV